MTDDEVLTYSKRDYDNKLSVYSSENEAPPIDFLLTQKLTTTTLSTNATIGSDVISVTDATGAAAGKYVEIWEGELFFQAEIKSVNVSDLTLFMPIGFPFSTAAAVYICNADMNVLGTQGAPIEFSFKPPFASGQFTQDMFLSRLIFKLTHAVAGDDEKFGGIAALTNGVYFGGRGEISGLEVFVNQVNMKANKDLAVFAYDVVYTDRAGGLGTYGTNVRISFNGQDKHNCVLPVREDRNEYIFAKVRDDLTTLTSFRIGVTGTLKRR